MGLEGNTISIYDRCKKKQIQIHQLHVKIQELNWCKKRNSNTTNSREKCNHLRYLIPRSICDAWRENRKCLNVKTCSSWRKGLPVLKLQEKVISFFKKENKFDVYFSDVWVVVWYFALRLRLPFCHSMENWCVRAISCIGLESPPPHTHVPYSSNTIIPHSFNALQCK